MASYWRYILFNFLLVHYTFASTVSDQAQFSSFIKTYGKLYREGSEEYNRRFDNFKSSLERHRKLNYFSNNANGVVYGITKFSDLTQAEFAEQVLSRPQDVLNLNGTRPSDSSTVNEKLDNIPKAYDLREQHVVTAIKDQKECGGCWAFSIVETLETQFALKYHKLYTLSVQEVLECARGSYGCKGGNTCTTAEWLNETSVKLTTDKNYPFTDDTNACRISKQIDGKVGITNYSCHGYINRESDMVNTVFNHGPLTVAVDATSWQDYVSGVIQHHCSAQADNHAVQVIGFDTSGPVPYYVVRNSWGKDWGVDGYLYIKIGGNLCGIANSVVTLTV
ncbi:putative cathepsin O [Apostichopus japonicus]|uniref:Putative cathepsin O n=1 Tax=Stichopus japonicus TaxID=307972 RepID=A0A2G8KAM0_STIJA|nr:putative cathepsin O [Apostichopus japonicus]